MMAKVERMRALARTRGMDWALLFGLRTLGMRSVRRLDGMLARIEMTRRITGEHTVSREYHTVQDNKRWDATDWSKFGEEWTEDARDYRGLNPAEWKQALVKGFMLPYTVPTGHTLEIGPGGGRWTALLVEGCARLTVADLNEKCLEICRERFKTFDTLRYVQVETDGATFLPKELVLGDSIDFVWSYDVFVHINAEDIAKYLRDLERVMKGGAVAIIHHAGEYGAAGRPATRSFVNAPLFAHLATSCGFAVLEQNLEMAHYPGDVVSVIRKGGRVEAERTHTPGSIAKDGQG